MSVILLYSADQKHFMSLSIGNLSLQCMPAVNILHSDITAKQKHQDLISHVSDFSKSLCWTKILLNLLYSLPTNKSTSIVDGQSILKPLDVKINETFIQ